MQNAMNRFALYWSANMSWALALSDGADWPFFRYTAEEKKRMGELTQAAVPSFSLYVWWALVTVLFLIGAGAAATAMIAPLDPASTSGFVFMLVLLMLLVVSLGGIFPFTVLVASSLLAGGVKFERLSAEQQAWLPPLVNKVFGQFRTFAIVMSVIAVVGATLKIVSSGFDALSNFLMTVLSCMWAVAVLMSVLFGRSRR